MKRILSLLAGAVVTGLLAMTIAPQTSSGDFPSLGNLGQIQADFQAQMDALAALFAGSPVTATVKSINVASSGGFVCAADGIKTGDAKSIVAMSTEGKSFVITAPGEDRLRTLMSTLE